MILAIAFSRKDERQALKLMSWILFLSKLKKKPIEKKTTILMVPSKSSSEGAVFPKISELASQAFRNVVVDVPKTHHEKGWPSSPNFMFKHVLLGAEQMKEDVLFIEPDSIPVTEGWLGNLFSEYDSGSKPFMGAYVNLPNTDPNVIHVPHMTGVGCYSWKWRKHAPMLADADAVAWDVFAAPQILPNAKFTRRIQHIFFNPVIDSFDIVNPGVDIFHQDKKGKLIDILDETRYNLDWLRSYSTPEIHEPMKYFYTPSAIRPIMSGGRTFEFEPIYQHAGAWVGTFSSNDPVEIDQLNALVAAGNMAVTEITKAEYDSIQKKKPGAEPSSPIQVRQIAVVDQSPAVRAVEEGEQKESNISTLRNFVTLGKIEPAKSESLAKQKRPRLARAG